MARTATSMPLRITAVTLLFALAACATNGTSAETTANSSATSSGPDVRDSHDEGHATSHRRFDDVEKWSRVFDDPSRAEWQRPAELVAALEIRPGMTVADVGAGTGFFLRYLSDAVGNSGKVLALEVETNLVSHMKNRVHDEKLANVNVALTPLDGLAIEDGSTDVLLMVDAYHHIDHRIDYFRSAAAKLAEGGRIALVDWKLGKTPHGPAEDHKIAPEIVEREMINAGYRLVASPDVLPYQYVLVFSR